MHKRLYPVHTILSKSFSGQLQLFLADVPYPGGLQRIYTKGEEIGGLRELRGLGRPQCLSDRVENEVL